MMSSRTIATLTAAIVVTVAVVTFASESRHPHDQEAAMQPVLAGTPRGLFALEASQPRPQPTKPKRSDYSRTTFHEPGKSLLQMLRDSDADVEVIVTSSAHNLTDGEDAVEQLEGFTRAAPAVVLVHTMRIHGELAASGLEINSILEGSVTEVLKNRTKVELQAGSLIAIPYRGGEILVSGRRVGYREDWKALPSRNHSYVVFYAESNGRLNPNTFDRMFEINGDQIRRMTQESDWGMGAGISASVALNVVRAAAGLPAAQ